MAKPSSRRNANGLYIQISCVCVVDVWLPRPDLHPLMQRFSALLDAGAVPIWQGSRLRAITRERMAPAAKVLMTALARAWDPEGVLGA